MRSMYICALPLLLGLTGGCGVAVGSGQVGVLWRAKNGTQSNVYGEGKHLISPRDRMYVYDLRSQSHDENLSGIARDGLGLKLGMTVRYHVVPQEVVALQQEIGPRYYEKIVAPLMRAETLRVISQQTPEEIYSTKRKAIEHEIEASLCTRLMGQHIALEAVLLRDVELPAVVRAAIDEKAVTQQHAQKTQYDLAIARAAAEQKRTEAYGAAEYNRTVRPSLNQQILQWQHTQQLSRLASSPNAKTVVTTSVTPTTLQIH